MPCRHETIEEQRGPRVSVIARCVDCNAQLDLSWWRRVKILFMPVRK